MEILRADTVVFRISFQAYGEICFEQCFELSKLLLALQISLQNTAISCFLSGPLVVIFFFLCVFSVKQPVALQSFVMNYCSSPQYYF